MEDIIKSAMAGVASLADSDKVPLKNKHYTMVAQRVQAFRAAAGVEGQILTEVVEQTDQRVMVKASISVWRDGAWSLVANDFAEEYRNQGPVNKTSALENCCTSAIGRALSAAGLSGGEYASSFEVDNAIHAKPAAVAAPKPKAEAPKPKKAPESTPTPAKEPETEQLDDLQTVFTGMVTLMDIEKTVKGLRTFFKNNSDNVTRMQNEDKKMYDELVEKFKEKSVQLSSTGAE
tara:strand:- start:2549 stop:3247 length:699 start_codon:yes stop_codon:yes gene_type:complete